MSIEKIQTFIKPFVYQFMWSRVTHSATEYLGKSNAPSIAVRVNPAMTEGPLLHFTLLESFKSTHLEMLKQTACVEFVSFKGEGWWWLKADYICLVCSDSPKLMHNGCDFTADLQTNSKCSEELSILWHSSYLLYFNSCKFLALLQHEFA